MRSQTEMTQSYLSTFTYFFFVCPGLRLSHNSIVKLNIGHKKFKMIIIIIIKRYKKRRYKYDVVLTNVLSIRISILCRLIMNA